MIFSGGGAQICEYLWVGFGVVWILWAIRSKPVQRRESVSSRLAYSVVTIAGFYAMFGRRVPGVWLHAVLLSSTPWTEITGVAVTAAGLGFAIWARAYLGGNWSGAVTVKVGHELIRTGPYRWVRHPIYSGFLLGLLGTALVSGQVRGLVAVVLVYAGFKIKSRLEERVMRGVFGTQYDEYSRTTGAIIPRFNF